jgi:hypothetical protein
MRRPLTRFVLIGGLIGLTACANLYTINRATKLPTSEDSSGKAVHLDVQQRLLIVNEFGTYCAEPSPDALAAFANAFGIGASNPSSGSLSAAGATQSSAASIGLRTQSITLMRDALFRMCEAYANGAVGTAQVAALLSRSQDLTAVILAVEQLTGAVVANQAALTGTASADALATAVSSAELLEAAIANEELRQERLIQAKSDLADAKVERDAADRALLEARNARDALPSDASQEQKTEAKNDVDFRQLERDRNQRAVEAAQEKVVIRQKSLENAQKSREQIEAHQDAAASGASASTTSAAQFSAPAQRIQLDKAATKAIAGSVESIVTEVLRKDYTIESCMAIVTTMPIDYDDWSPELKVQFDKTRGFCIDLVNATILEKTKAITTSYGADDTSNRIDAWLIGPGNRERLRAWLKTQEPDIPVFALLQGSYPELRQKAISQFNIP